MEGGYLNTFIEIPVFYEAMTWRGLVIDLMARTGSCRSLEAGGSQLTPDSGLTLTHFTLHTTHLKLHITHFNATKLVATLLKQ